jgi:hypothetical protein
MASMSCGRRMAGGLLLRLLQLCVLAVMPPSPVLLGDVDTACAAAGMVPLALGWSRLGLVLLLACASGEAGSCCDPMREAGIFGEREPSEEWLMEASRTSGCASGMFAAQARYARRCCLTKGRFRVSATLGLSLVSFASRRPTRPMRPLLYPSGKGLYSAAAILR